MASRQEELQKLQSYIKEVDKEVTLILQSLQWDRKQLLQSIPNSTCLYDSNHKVPPEKLKEHEAKCVLKSQDYADDDTFLPDVLDPNANTVMKLSAENIKDILNYASKTDPEFNRGDRAVTSTPLTAERLQASYTADERRAIYDVVIHSRPACDDLADLTLGEMTSGSQSQGTQKSKLQRLAELRDMKRRRAKYKVAVRACNYSHTLRGLIEAQMEMYTEAQRHTKPNSHDVSYNKNHNQEKHSEKNLNYTRDTPTDMQKERKDVIYEKEKTHNYNENKRKRNFDDDRNSRIFERDRIRSSSGAKREYYNNDKSRRRDRKTETYEEETDRGVHSIDTEDTRNRDNDRKEDRRSKLYRTKVESDVKTTIDAREKYCSHRVQERGSDTYKKEIDLERMYDKSKNIPCFIKKERDCSNSRDSRRYRESERDERYYKDRSKDMRRTDSEQKRYDYQYIKKEREYTEYREKKKRKE